jgi:hypothetical protein
MCRFYVQNVRKYERRSHRLAFSYTNFTKISQCNETPRFPTSYFSFVAKIARNFDKKKLFRLLSVCVNTPKNDFKALFRHFLPLVGIFARRGYKKPLESK